MIAWIIQNQRKYARLVDTNFSLDRKSESSQDVMNDRWGRFVCAAWWGAQRAAEACQKEVRMRAMRQARLPARVPPTRMRKLVRDMLHFWKKVDKEVRVHLQCMTLEADERYMCRLRTLSACRQAASADYMCQCTRMVMYPPSTRLSSVPASRCRSGGMQGVGL